MQRVDWVVEVMSWKIKGDKIKEELDWLRVQKSGIENSRVCKENLATGMTWHSNQSILATDALTHPFKLHRGFRLTN